MKRYIAALFALGMLLVGCTNKVQNGGNISDTTDTNTAVDTYSDTADADETDVSGEIYRDDVYLIVKDDEKINVFYDCELEGVYEDCFLLYDSTGGINPYLLEKVDDGVRIYRLDALKEKESYIIANTAEQYGNLIVTDERIYDALGRHIMQYSTYMRGGSVTDITAEGDDVTVTGTDANGEAVSLKYTAGMVDAYLLPAPEITVTNGKIRACVNLPVWGNGGSSIGKLEVDAPADPERIGSFGEYITYQTDTHLFFVDGDAVIYVSEGNGFMHAVYDDFFAVGDEHYIPYTVYGKDFERAFADEFYSFAELSDGNYIAEPKPVALPAGDEVYRIYNAEKEIVYSGKNDESGAILDVGTDYVLRKKDNMLKLYTPYGELMCELGEVADTMGFHPMLSGVGNKNGVKCYYFVFSDDGNKDKDGNIRHIEYYYVPETGETSIIDNGYSPFAYAKPVLYLYPTEETDITVTFAHPERLTTVYPAYNDIWSVTASPDGTLTDARGRNYYALYWEESSGTPYYDFADGFCVAGEDSAAFLEEKLAALGFTEREANEFIIYWLPIMEANEYNIIRFELTEEREASNALCISPKPDSMLRMAMHIKALDEPVEIPAQEIPTFERIGFTAVEWGGCVH